MNKIKLYLQETVAELVHKVSWPTWEELQRSAVTVLVASVIIALIIWVMDQASNFVLSTYYHLFD